MPFLKGEEVALMAKDFPKQDSRKAVGLPASGKGKAVRNRQ